jgi:hypothetical protein
MSEHEQAGGAARKGADDPKVRDEIIRAVREVRYGSVEITIHDAKVVQVERREKIRFQEQKEK